MFAISKSSPKITVHQKCRKRSRFWLNFGKTYLSFYTSVLGGFWLVLKVMMCTKYLQNLRFKQGHLLYFCFTQSLMLQLQNSVSRFMLVYDFMHLTHTNTCIYIYTYMSKAKCSSNMCIHLFSLSSDTHIHTHSHTIG